MFKGNMHIYAFQSNISFFILSFFLHK